MTMKMKRHLKSERHWNCSADKCVIISVPERVASLLRSIDTVLLQCKMKSKLKDHKGKKSKFLNTTDESWWGCCWKNKQSKDLLQQLLRQCGLRELSSALAGVSLWKEQRSLRAWAMERERAETKRPLGRQSGTSLGPLLFPSLALRNTLIVSEASLTWNMLLAWAWYCLKWSYFKKGAVQYEH